MAAIIGAVGGVSATLLGVLLKYLYDRTKQSQDACSLEDDRADKTYLAVIAEFRQRIAALETEVVSIRKAWGDEVRLVQKAWGDEVRELQREHQDCIRNHERLVAKVEMLERRQKSE